MNPFRFLKGRPLESAAQRLYDAAVRQARNPEFYENMGVPDTVEGRFELISLHTFLILHRLKQDHDATKSLAQALVDLMFRDMDHNLREMGVGDQRVPKRIMKMAENFYGRMGVYEKGLEIVDKSLSEALRRNLFHQAKPRDMDLDHMADYIRRQSSALSKVSLECLLEGDIGFWGPSSGP
ncbi:MAG: hypothetical protein OEY85_05130 [Rhodospirillales bacterium]|nr:hypothetical protein [Rhodospirillales bacterium]